VSTSHAAAEATNLRGKLALLDKPWSPRLLAELNGQHVRIAKLDGEFTWHAHQDEDELFLVIEGEIEIQLREGPDDAERSVRIAEGELFVVPRGVEHKPVAKRPASVLLFEPASTRNTGDADDERAIDPNKLERV